MTDRYVGPGGSDGASGLTWALRKLTLNGVEASPVVAGDTVYVGAGNYHEEWTTVVAGTSGNPITFIGDISGINTDGVGGEIRVVNSDDDKTVNTANFVALRVDADDYRTFIGMRFGMGYTATALVSSSNYAIFEDCVFDGGPSTISEAFYYSGSGIVGLRLRRCFFIGRQLSCLLNNAIDDSDTEIENCVFYSSGSDNAWVSGMGGTTFKNCTFFSAGSDIHTVSLLLGTGLVPGTRVASVYNCVFNNGRIESNVTGGLIEDYGYYIPYWGDADTRVAVTKGANSITRNLMKQPNLLYDGFYFLQNPLDLHRLSPIKNYACGQTPPSDDFYGLPRPTSDSKKTRGAIQLNPIERETTIVPSGETESIKMADASVHQIFIPITGKTMTFSVEAYRETDYAGTNPQMTIKQPGQSDRTTTDVGSANQFNALSDTFQPANLPSWVVMEIRSDNTATSGSYATYWGGFKVK